MLERTYPEQTLKRVSLSGGLRAPITTPNIRSPHPASSIKIISPDITDLLHILNQTLKVVFKKVE
jgi:hypothetical protein